VICFFFQHYQANDFCLGSLSVDPKFVHPSAPDVPAEHPARDFQSDVYPGLFELQPIVSWTTHAVPFASGPGRLPGKLILGAV
jgi:hypothetical protein